MKKHLKYILSFGLSVLLTYGLHAQGIEQKFGAYALTMDSLYTHVGLQGQYVIVYGEHYVNDGFGAIFMADSTSPLAEVPRKVIKVTGTTNKKWIAVQISASSGDTGVFNNPDYAVINILTTPPGSPADQDKYLAGQTQSSGAAGAWINEDTYIETWDAGTSAWIPTVPTQGQLLINGSNDDVLLFDGTNWNVITSTYVFHNKLDNYGPVNLSIGNKRNKRFDFGTNNIIRGGFAAAGYFSLYYVRNGSTSDSVAVFENGEIRRVSRADYLSGVGGATAFIGLSDVPNSYASQALKLVRVNSGATGLEFFTPTYLTSYTETDPLSVHTGDAAGGDLTGTYPNPTIATNAVTNAKMRQSAGLSVIGRSANSTGDVADITAGSDNQVLRRSGTAIGFGSIDLSQSNTVGSSILPVANGGTGTSTPSLVQGTGVTITGTWPNQTINSTGGAGGSSSVFDSLTWIDNVRYNILPTNSEATNSANFITAINYLISRGGGTLYLRYSDSAYKGQIVIPAITGTTWLPIRILGATSPASMFGTVGGSAYTANTKGVIIQSSSTTSGEAVIKVTANGGSFSALKLVLQNLDIRTYDSTLISGVKAGWAQQFQMDNGSVNTGIFSADAAQPTRTNCVGIETPFINNGAFTQLNNVSVSGFYTGIDVNEHTYTTGLNTVASCIKALNINASYHEINLMGMHVYDSRYGLYGSGVATVHGNIDIEHGTRTGKYTWMNTAYDINDSLNLINGFLIWHTVEPGTGPTGTFTKNGGTGIYTYDMRTFAPALLTLNNTFNTGGDNTQTLVSTGANQAALQWKIGSNNNFKIYQNGSSNNRRNGGIYNNATSSTIAYWDSTGAVNLGAGASSTSTAPIAISAAGSTVNLFNGLFSLSSATFFPFTLATANPYLCLNSTTSHQTSIFYQQNGTSNYQLGMDWSNNGTKDFYIHQQFNGKPKFYINSTGDVFLGDHAINTPAMSILTGTGRVGIGVIAPTAMLHLKPGTVTASTAPLKFAYSQVATTAASGTGSVVTLTYASTSPAPFYVGETIVVSGVTPSGYNGTFAVVSATTTQVTYSNATTGSQTVAGTITAGQLLSTAEAGAMEYDGTGLYFTNAGAQRQQIEQTQPTRLSTQFDKTSSTALSNITGLTATLVAGKTYRFEAVLYTSSDVAGGVQFAIGGTATATNIIYEAIVDNAAVISAQTRATALATAVGGVTAVTNAYSKITGTITVNAAGTLTVQFAQNASNGSASSVLVGSTFTVTQIP